jgi:hypothetical protein
MNKENNSNLTSENIRMWKLNYQYNTREKFVEFLKDNSLGGPTTVFKDNDPLNDIEENTGVNFPGN